MTNPGTEFFELFGITSYGATFNDPNSFQGCGKLEIPGVFTRVDSYLDWIARNIRD